MFPVLDFLLYNYYVNLYFLFLFQWPMFAPILQGKLSHDGLVAQFTRVLEAGWEPEQGIDVTMLARMFFVRMEKLRQLKAGFEALRDKRKVEVSETIVRAVQTVVPNYTSVSMDEDPDSSIMKVSKLMEAMIYKQQIQDLAIARLESMDTRLSRLESMSSMMMNMMSSIQTNVDLISSKVRQAAQAEKDAFLQSKGDFITNTLKLSVEDVEYLGYNQLTFKGVHKPGDKVYYGQALYKISKYNMDGTYDCIFRGYYNRTFNQSSSSMNNICKHHHGMLSLTSPEGISNSSWD